MRLHKSNLSFIALYVILTFSCIVLVFQNPYKYSWSENKINFNNGTIFKTMTNSNITIGKPIFYETYTVTHSRTVVVNGINETQFSFTGTGVINKNNVTVQGNGISIPKSENVQFVIGNATILSAQGGFASYSFRAFDYSNQVTQGIGAAFFNSNASGDLSSLSNTMGIYKIEVIESNGSGKFVMWEWKYY